MADGIDNNVTGPNWQTNQAYEPPQGQQPNNVDGNWQANPLHNVDLQDIGDGQQVAIPLRQRGPAQTTIEQRLMTFDTLMERCGDHQPKTDLKIFGHKVWRHSTALKALEQNMRAYHQALTQPLGPNESRTQRLETLRDPLADAMDNAQAYIDKHRHNHAKAGNVAEMRVMLAQIQNEMGLINRVIEELGTGGDDDTQSASVNELLQAKRFGLSLLDCSFDKYSDNNLDPNRTIEHYRGGNVNHTSKLVYDDDTVRIFKPLQPATSAQAIEQVEVLLGGSRELPRSGVRNLTACAVDRALGTDLLVRTEIGMHGGHAGLMMEEATGHPCKYKVAIPQTPEDSQQLSDQFRNYREQVPIYDEQKLFAEMMECDIDEYGNLLRNEEGRVLKFRDEHTDFNTVFGQPLTDQQKAELHQQIMGLQWLDSLSAEYDRHPGNFLIDMVNGQIKVTGIDNDACFGIRDAQPIDRPVGNGGIHNTGVPDLIDRALFDRLNEPGLFDNDILPELEGRLSDQEIQHVRSRFDALLARANELDPQYIVDDWQAWRSPDGETVEQFLESRTESTSIWKHHFGDPNA